MKAATYTRVSTDDQVQGASLEVQRERCGAYAERQGWTVVAEFSDPGASGAFFDRAGLLAALRAAEHGEVEVLIAYDLDRFSRGVWAQLATAAEEAGLRLVTADGVIDTDDDERELPADMLDAFAKHQRKLTTKRSMASRAVRVRSGNWVGGVAPYGHVIAKGERGSVLEVNEDERLAVERAFELMLDEGCSPGEAADRLNAEGFDKRGRRWTSRNLIQTLSRSTLAGRFVYGKVHRAKTRYDAARYGIEGHEVEVPRVVSEERWVAMQALLSGIKWTKKTAHEYPLSGRILTEDGHAYTGRFDTSNQKRRYRCRERYDQSVAHRVGAHCSHKEISADAIEAAVWWALEDEFRQMDKFYELLEKLDETPVDSEAAAQAKAQHAARLKKLRDERVTVEARGLRDGFSRASIEAALAEFDADIATVEAEFAAAEAWLENAVRRDAQLEALSSWERMNELFDRPDLAMVKRLYEALDLKVTLTGSGQGEVQINLPLDVGLETIVSATTSTRAARRRAQPRRRSGKRRSAPSRS
jgi:DNA invertase Pin-like site-specific DNA recombinase